MPKICPDYVDQKGSVGQIHDGRDDKDHEAELRKAGGKEKGEVVSSEEKRPHEEE